MAAGKTFPPYLATERPTANAISAKVAACSACSPNGIVHRNDVIETFRPKLPAQLIHPVSDQ
jgi:hypothetical protein